MSHAHSRYHCAVKHAKRKLNYRKAEDFLAVAESGDVALMKEMRTTLKKKSTGQAVPDCLEGKVTPDTILDKFRECYEYLYNSANTSAEMITIKEKLENMITISSLGEVNKITGEQEQCCHSAPNLSENLSRSGKKSERIWVTSWG